MIFDNDQFTLEIGLSKISWVGLRMVNLSLPKDEVERYSRQILVDHIGVKGRHKYSYKQSRLS
jgi:hypothetical protein